MKEKPSASNTPLLALTLVLSLVLLLSLTIISHAGRGCHDFGTGLQYQNLGQEPLDFTAHFHHLDGSQAHSFSGDIQPGCNAYYQVDDDDAITGTVRTEATQEIVGANLHFASEEFNGNDVFEMLPDDLDTSEYYAPRVERNRYGVSSILMIGNAGSVPAVPVISFYEPNGPLTAVLDDLEPIPVNGSLALKLAETGVLTNGFIGAAEIHTQAGDQFIWVDVVQDHGDQLAIYPAAPAGGGGGYLYLPYLPGHEADLITPTINVQNPNEVEANVTIAPGGINLTIPAHGSEHLIPPSVVPQAYTISSDQAVAAMASIQSQDAVIGSAAYAAMSLEHAAPYQYAPLLLNGYEGWSTTLWAYNPTGLDTAVRITLTGSFPTPQTVSIPDVDIPSGQAVAIEPPPSFTAQHYAAQVVAKAPGEILTLVMGSNETGGLTDGNFAYRGSGSLILAPPCTQEAIPTLSEWAYILLAVLVLLIGAWSLNRRRRTALAKG